ncbi:MAG TPA: FlgD immunoglobulin-like domain containing protein, partial [Candidatus Eisenbacteria bacterium]
SDGLQLCNAPGDQTRPQGISLSNGDVVLAWSDMRSDAGDIYLTRIGANLPNLSVADAGFGFDLPLVPRNRNDATPSQARLSPVLDGGQATTRLNWSVTLEGSNVIAGWGLDVTLDGLPLVSVPDMGPSAPGTVIALNQGPWTVRGGRHTLTLRADPAGAVREATESDNINSCQFVWSPEALVPGTFTDRPAPPARGTFTEPNSHGYVIHPGASAWGVAVGAGELGKDVDLIAYDDYSGSTSGLSHRVAASGGGPGRVDWVVGSAAFAPSIYPAVTAGAEKGSQGNYVMTSVDATGRRGTSDTGRWAAQPMAANKLLDVYDLDLVAGRAYHLTLVRALGRAPVEFYVLPPAAGAYGPDDAIATSTHLTADGEGVGVLTFVPTVTGRYPVAVARTTTEWLDEGITYHFFYSTQVSGVGDVDAAPRAMVLSAPWPNPTASATRVTLSLPEAGPVDVRLFDVHGRLVATLLEATLPAGAHAIAWDGRDAAGTPVPAGLYFVRSTALGDVRTQRVVVRH